jgi:hypothetical protein
VVTVEIGQRLGRSTLQCAIAANATPPNPVVIHEDLAGQYGSRTVEFWQPWSEIEHEGVAAPPPGHLPPAEILEGLPEATVPFQRSHALYAQDCNTLMHLFDPNRLR